MLYLETENLGEMRAMVEQLLGPPEDVPDYYVDAVRIAVGAYGFVLELGAQGIGDTPVSEKPPTKRLAVIRMSPQHAMILAKLLQKNVAAYQQNYGPISLPDEMFRTLGLEPG
jgi:hypothetical protein